MTKQAHGPLLVSFDDDHKPQVAWPRDGRCRQKLAREDADKVRFPSSSRDYDYLMESDLSGDGHCDLLKDL